MFILVKVITINPTYTVNFIDKTEGTLCTYRNTKDFSGKSIRNAKERKWIHVLQTTFLYALNDRIADEFKDHKTYNNVASKFSSLPRKHGRAIRGKNKIDV